MAEPDPVKSSMPAPQQQMTVSSGNTPTMASPSPITSSANVLINAQPQQQFPLVQSPHNQVLQHHMQPPQSPMPHGQIIQSPQGQIVQSPQGQLVQSPQGQIVQSPQGQMVQATQGQIVQSPQNQVFGTPGQMLQTAQGQMMTCIQPSAVQIQPNSSLSSQVQSMNQLLTSPQSNVQHQSQFFSQQAQLLPQMQYAQQQVQVIQQPMNSAFLQQYYTQQQQITNMLQSAATMQALQARGITPGQLNLALQQSRPQMLDTKTNQPATLMMSTTPQIQQVSTSIANQTAASNNTVASANGSKNQPITSKPPTTAPNSNNSSSSPTNQSANIFAGKQQLIRQQTTPHPLVINQILPQCTGPQTVVSQGKAIAVAGSTNQPQLLSSATQLRFSAAPQLSATQIINAAAAAGGHHQHPQGATAATMITNPAVLSQLQAMAIQQGLPMGAQQVFSSQSPTILNGQQPLYIRTANPIQHQPQQQQQQQQQQQTQLPGMVSIAAAGIAPFNSREKANAETNTTMTLPQTKIVNTPSKHTTGSQTVRPTVIGQAAGVQRPLSTNGATQTLGQTNKAGTPKLVSRVKGKSQSVGSGSPLPAAVRTSSTGTQDDAACPSPIPPLSPKLAADTPGAKDGRSHHNSKDTCTSTEPPRLEKQRAIVKPHILTHVIEGFVIQEALEPFPVQRSSLLTDVLPAQRGLRDKDSGDEDRRLGDTPDSMGAQATLKCEFCGKVDIAKRFKRSKRFCSTACAKRYNVGCSRRIGRVKSDSSGLNRARPLGIAHSFSPSKFAKNRRHAIALRRVWRRQQGAKPFLTLHARKGARKDSESTNNNQSERLSDTSSQSCRDDTSSPGTPTHHPFDMETNMADIDMSKSPDKWNVDEVTHFIRSLPGCGIYADDFKSQEIDGQALMLLKEDHLMTAMNIKLGPALKMCARINALKGEPPAP